MSTAERKSGRCISSLLVKGAEIWRRHRQVTRRHPQCSRPAQRRRAARRPAHTHARAHTRTHARTHARTHLVRQVGDADVKVRKVDLEHVLVDDGELAAAALPEALVELRSPARVELDGDHLLGLFDELRRERAVAGTDFEHGVRGLDVGLVDDGLAQAGARAARQCAAPAGAQQRPATAGKARAAAGAAGTWMMSGLHKKCWPRLLVLCSIVTMRAGARAGFSAFGIACAALAARALVRG